MNSSVVTVLIVDDQPAFCRVASDILDATDLFRAAGVATSGEDALRELDQQPYDVVLLDVQMPGIGGLEAARAIRERHPETIVLLTSVADGPDLLAEVDRIDAHYISKAELGPEQLERRWAEIVARRRAGGADGPREE